jgi:hypothetical protein
VIGLPVAELVAPAVELAELVAPPPPLVLLLELLPFVELPQAATARTAPSASPDVRHLRRILISLSLRSRVPSCSGRTYRGTAIVCKGNVASGLDGVNRDPMRRLL